MTASWHPVTPEWLTDSDGITPTWVRVRQVQAINALGFQAPKPTKAKPLDHAQIRDALEEHFHVYVARELVGLDVWFLQSMHLTTGLEYDMILYEHRGDWHCLCVRERNPG